MKKRREEICRRKRFPFLIAAIVVIGVLSIAVCPGLFQAYGQNPRGGVEKVRLADGILLPSAPIYVALEKGFFKQEGLEISYSRFLTGKESLEAVVGGKADLATAADTPIAFQAMKDTKIYIIATLSSTEKLYGIIGRKDQGISSPKDLQGKKIGVAFGTNAHFFLDSFLLFHRIPRNRVRLTNVSGERLADAIMKGDIQAVSIWEPLLSEIRTQLGTNASFFHDDRGQLYKLTWNVAATQDFVHKNPEIVKRFLRALIKAEAFIRGNREEARRITAQYLGTEKGAFGELWKSYKSEISLDSLLVENLEGQTRWAITNKLTDRKGVPNYLQYIYFKGLESVKPEAVTIVH